VHINTAYGALISVTTLILIALSATLITSLLLSTTSNIHTTTLAQTTEETATLIILPSIGGITDKEPGTYNITAGHEITLTAIPSEGFFFRYWVISGDMPNQENSLALDSNVVSTNPVTVICEQGSTYRFQAVFTSNADLTLEDLPKGITLTESTETIIFLVIIALSEAVILGVLYVRHNKKRGFSLND